MHVVQRQFSYVAENKLVVVVVVSKWWTTFCWHHICHYNRRCSVWSFTELYRCNYCKAERLFANEDRIKNKTTQDTT